MMTDPKRLPNPLDAARRLPRGGAIIYRHFGTPDRLQTAWALRQITFERGQQLLIGADTDLAKAVGADGVHFKRDAALAEPSLWRKRCPDWIISMAGIKDGSYGGNLSVLDGLLVSAIFPSESPSAGPAIGADRLKIICENLNVPVFALGGVNRDTAHILVGTGAAGLAGVGHFTD